MSGDYITVDEDIVGIAMDLAAVRSAKAKVVEEEQDLRDRLIAVLDTQGVDIAMTSDGRVAFTRSTVERQIVDSKKLQALHPEVHATVLKPSKSTTIRISDEIL